MKQTLQIVKFEEADGLINYGGKEFNGAQLTHKNKDGKVFTKSFNERSKDYEKIVSKLRNLEEGEYFTVEIDLNDEYKPWVSIEPATSFGESKPKPTGNSNPYKGGAGKPNTYATPEERAKTQDNIIRQHAVTKAIEILTANKETIDLTKVFDLADDISHYSSTGERPKTTTKGSPRKTTEVVGKKKLESALEEEQYEEFE